MFSHSSMIVCTACGNKSKRSSFLNKDLEVTASPSQARCKGCRDSGKSLNKRWSKKVSLDDIRSDIDTMPVVAKRPSNLGVKNVI